MTGETPIETGQVWRDEYGNEFAVTHFRSDGRVGLLALRYQNARYPTPGFLAEYFTLVPQPSSRPAEATPLPDASEETP